jgi:hypothetical protein
MTAPLPDLAAWYEANDAYLAAAIEWLRLLLSHQAPAAPGVVPTEPLPTPASPPAPEPQEPTAGPWWKFRRSGATDRPADVSTRKARLALPPGSSESAQQAINAAHERMVAAEGSDPPPALTALARRLGLSSFERDLLLLCVAMELDTGIGALCARAQDDPALPFPTFGLGFALFDAPGWDARSPDHPLRYWRLIELNQPWGHPLTTSALRADERIVNHVKGLSHLDDRLVSFLAPLGEPVDEQALPASHRHHVDEILATLGRDQPDLLPIQLLGRDAESRQGVAGAVARRLGLTVYRLQADILPSAPADLETLARLWQRETLLLPVALYVDASDVERVAELPAAALRRFIGRCGGLVFVQAREAWPISQGSHWFDVDKPTPMEQRAHWRAVLGDGHDDTAAELAAQFSLSTPAITRIVTAAAEDGSTPLPERLWARAAQQTRLRIDALAQRIDAKATWDDIVLPAPETALLRQIVAHVEGRGKVYDEWGFRERMNRGFGISALFAGASGTGKTMAAEVIANELELSLHRIDLSSVVSKWVGETEKNLQQLFNAADDGNGILFFDEADALFGKRTEVQQSQDRFANIEINFLLQRLESYRGLAILATNMKTALDQGFLRRLAFIVNFAFPGPEERRAIWQRAFPRQTPTEGLDFDRLAKLTLAGGSVHNIALSAAFIAAKRGSPVTMPIVFEAAKTEMRKIEKPVHEADFKWGDKALELAR